MATAKQKAVVDRLVEKGGRGIVEPIGKTLAEVGYSKAVIKTPQKVTEAKGFKELLNEYLPDDLILGSLRDDIKAKPKKRLGELALAAKIKGMDKEPEAEKQGDTYNLTQVNIEASKETARELLEEYKRKTIGDVSQ